MTYQEAQSRIDDTRLTDGISEDLRLMNKLAKKLRQRRFEGGALELASPEVKFEIDTETHNPLDVGMYQVRSLSFSTGSHECNVPNKNECFLRGPLQLRDTNRMVEEMMLLANIAVAREIEKNFKFCAVLRKHAVPAPHMFDPLIK